MFSALPTDRTVQFRPIRPDDAERLVAFHESLDPYDQYLRFFSVHPHLTTIEIERFTHVDHHEREAVVVIDGTDLVGVGRYERLEDPTTAEVAFVVSGPWRGHGLATDLLHRLAAIARENGISTFVAETLAVNHQMLDVFRHAGYPSTCHFVDGVMETHLDITRAGPDR
ncbi:hypothetical protein BH10ACT1_BH10ACT1_22900 [soil metagenome]